MSESLTLRREWTGIETFLLELKTKPVPTENTKHHIGGNGGAEWYGTEDYDEAASQAENGWPAGLARIQTLTKKLKYIEGEKTDRHVATFAECGDEVEIGRFVESEPECMMDFKLVQVPAAGRVVKIIANLSASCGLDAESLFMRGASAVLLADMVEQAGLRSEIWIIASGTNGSAGYDFRVLVKAPDQPLELDRMAFTLASPAMYRRLMFKAMEQVEPRAFLYHMGTALGCPRNVTEPNAITVDALQYGFGNNLTDETVPKFVNAMVQKYFES